MLNPMHYSLPGLYWLVSSQCNFHNFMVNKNPEPPAGFYNNSLSCLFFILKKKRATNTLDFFKKGFETFKLINSLN